jgi:zinc protease
MRASRTKGEAFVLASGIPVLVERDMRLPLVDVSVDIQLGKLDDPQGLEGLSRLFGSGIRSGPRGMSEVALANALDTLGGRLGVTVAKRAIRLRGAVLARHAPAFITLIARVLREPAFRPRDVERARRRLIASAETLADDDRALAHRAFYGVYFHGHPFGRALGGTPETLARVSLDDLLERHATMRSSRVITIGLAGALPEDAHRSVLEEAFGDFGGAGRAKRALREHRPRRGLRVVIVDKPERTQCQMVLGSRGLRIGDAATVPIQVANHAFGGSFVSTLVREVRSKRGYSYGASSVVGQGPVRDATMVQTFPTSEHAIPCAKLLLRLFDSFVNQGVSARALRAAKEALVRGHAFELETAEKRLESRLEVETLGVPAAHHDRYVELVQGVDVEAANEAVRSRLSSRDLVLVVVGEEAKLKKKLERLPEVREVLVFSHHALGSALTLEQ